MVIYKYYRDNRHSGIGVYDNLDEAMKAAYKDSEQNIATSCEITDGEKEYSFNEIKEYWENKLITNKKDKLDPFQNYGQKKNGQQSWP